VPIAILRSTRAMVMSILQLRKCDF
jgi:hypothetical protein